MGRIAVGADRVGLGSCARKKMQLYANVHMHSYYSKNRGDQADSIKQKRYKVTPLQRVGKTKARYNFERLSLLR